MKKRGLILLLCVTLLFGMVGCNNNTTTDESTLSESDIADLMQQTTIAEDREPVTITFGGWGHWILLREWFDAFEEKYPWITVEVVKPVDEDWYEDSLMRLAATGKMPDVFNSGEIETCLMNGWSVDLTPYFENDPDAENYLDWLLEYGSSNDRIYMIASCLYLDLMMVNTTMLDEVNAEIPDYNWTIDELVDVLRATTVKGESIGITNIVDMLRWLPAQCGNPDLSCFSYNVKTEHFEFGEEFVECLNLCKKVFDEELSLWEQLDLKYGNLYSGATAEENELIEENRDNATMELVGDNRELWRVGKYGTNYLSSYSVGWYYSEEYVGFDWEVYPMPVKEEGQVARTCVYPDFMCVSTSAENPYECYLLVKWMSYDLDGYRAFVDIVNNYDQEEYIKKYEGVYPASYFPAGLGGVDRIPALKEDVVIDLFSTIDSVYTQKEGMIEIISNVYENGYVNGLTCLPNMNEIRNLIFDTIVNEVLSGKKSAADIVEDLERRCNAILDEERRLAGMIE